MRRKIHGHLFYCCDIPGRAHWCQHSLLLFATASAVCCLLSSELFLTLAPRFDHCLLAAGSGRMNRNEFMRMLERQYISISLIFCYQIKKSQSLTTQLHLPYIARNTDFYLSVSLPSNSHLAAYIEALFRINECYVLDFLFFGGRDP